MNTFLAYYESDLNLCGYTTLRIKAETIEQAHAEAIEKRLELSHAYAVVFDLIDVEPVNQ